MVTTIQREPVSSLAGLAIEIEQNQAGHQAQAEPADPQEAEALRMLQAGMGKLTLGVFKVLRKLLSKKLPELPDHWTDDVLQGPADAAVPLLNKYAADLMAKIGDKPELAVFCLSLLPLCLGYMEASNQHARTVDAPVATAANDGR